MTIIYKDFYKGLCMTSEENYNARIMNANKVCTLSDFATAEEARDWLCSYYHDTPDNYKIIED